MTRHIGALTTLLLLSCSTGQSRQNVLPTDGAAAPDFASVDNDVSHAAPDSVLQTDGPMAAPDGASQFDGTTAVPDSHVPPDGPAPTQDLGTVAGCTTLTNLAPQAQVYGTSGSGKYAYGAAVAADGKGEASCGYHWICNSLVCGAACSTLHCTDPNDSPGGVQLVWSKPVTIAKVEVDTIEHKTTKCDIKSAGRTLSSCELVYEDGGSWKLLTKVTGKADDWSQSFTPVTTKGLLIHNAAPFTLKDPPLAAVLFEVRVWGCAP
jgi:hypothetical protein